MASALFFIFFIWWTLLCFNRRYGLLLGLFGTCVAVDTKTSIIVQRKTDKFLQPRVSESSYQEQSDQKLYP